MMAKADFTFESNVPEAKSRLQTAQRAGLLAACLTVEKYVKEYSRHKTGSTRDSYGHELVEDGEALLGAIGSDEMNAIYEEYGTGEFAENGDGRKGGWVYYDPAGQQFIFTYGKEPNKPMRRGFNVARSEVQQMIGEAYSVEFGGG